MNSTFYKFACLLLGLIVVAGCGKSQPTLADLNNSNIMRLHSAYSMFTTANNYQGPKNEAELKAHLTTNQTAKVLLERMGIKPEDIDGIFISDRDGKPFKVRYGLNGIADHAIVFEAEGVEGKRLVAFATPRELEAKEYDDFLSGKAKPNAPGGDATDFEPEKIETKED